MLKHIFLPFLVLSAGFVRGQDCPSPFGPPTDEGYTTVNAAYFDTDGNGVVGLTDLMNLLSVYGAVVPVPFAPCGDPLTYQGHAYATVQIGDQCWFAENLRNEYYENGDAIPSNLSDSEWGPTTSGAVAVFGEDSGCNNYSPDIDACDPAQSLNEYGRLYNWYAVDDSRGLCPSGWHVPTDGEWTVMTDFLGGIEGIKMKTTYGWHGGGNGSNSSGFSGLPSGSRYNTADFWDAGLIARWWSCSPIGFYAWHRELHDSGLALNYGYISRSFGFSVVHQTCYLSLIIALKMRIVPAGLTYLFVPLVLMDLDFVIDE